MSNSPKKHGKTSGNLYKMDKKTYFDVDLVKKLTKFYKA